MPPHGLSPAFLVVVDDATNARFWDRLAGGLVGRLSVLVDLDVGQHRSGVITTESAISLARQIAGSKHLAFAGMQAYAGHVQHIVSRSSRVARAEACARRTRDAVQALVSAGLRPRIVTGGGTGTHGIEPDLGVLTEIQPGSYVLMDVEYEGIDLRHEDQTQFRPSLFVQTTVISRNVPRFVQTDAGTKAFALNGPLPEIIRGAPAGSAYNYLGDEHGQIKLPPGASPPRLGRPRGVPHTALRSDGPPLRSLQTARVVIA